MAVLRHRNFIPQNANVRLFDICIIIVIINICLSLRMLMLDDLIFALLLLHLIKLNLIKDHDHSN